MRPDGMGRQIKEWEGKGNINKVTEDKRGHGVERWKAAEKDLNKIINKIRSHMMCHEV